MTLFLLIAKWYVITGIVSGIILGCWAYYDHKKYPDYDEPE